ncbi:MAG TPA: hypothetical protein VFR23_25275, partial [Jiangellaceae bacterium]|nr:hypothetical protein [Jiangellaceae bacterium]
CARHARNGGSRMVPLADVVRPAVARAEAAEQAVQRVRELHRPDVFQPAHCDQCAVPYPCVTIRALDGTP